MKLVCMPDKAPRPLAFWLAMEEWLASHMAAGSDSEYFFIWQPAQTTVIIGRNQMLDREVNTEYCLRHGIDLVRRKSGGGAVVSDSGNMMLSYISSRHNTVEGTYSSYTSMVVRSLRLLGLDASDNARNDILIGGRKVAGNSYYRTAGGISIVHGTMLWDFNAELMGKTLTPPTSKLQSHGVGSVSSRVTSVKEHLPDLTIDRLRQHLLDTIPDETDCLTLTPSEVEEIDGLSRLNYNQTWLESKNPPGQLAASGRIDGVGELSMFVELDKGLVSDICLRGDFMDGGNASDEIAKALKGKPLRPNEVRTALESIDLPAVISGLTAEKLAALIFETE
ncbi:MAG: lipoate--protein ligase family protein [Muribaculaceae bacterium]|nr:lipoate--protein ligase family protein [Muribaculaceae bacterium]